MDHNPFSILQNLEDSKEPIEVETETEAEAEDHESEIVETETINREVTVVTTDGDSDSDSDSGSESDNDSDPPLETIVSPSFDSEMESLKSLHQLAVSMAEKVLDESDFQDLIEPLLHARETHRKSYVETLKIIAAQHDAISQTSHMVTGLSFQIKQLDILIQMLNGTAKSLHLPTGTPFPNFDHRQKMVSDTRSKYIANLVTQRIEARQTQADITSHMFEEIEDRKALEIRSSMMRSAAISVSRVVDQLNGIGLVGIDV